MSLAWNTTASQSPNHESHQPEQSARCKLVDEHYLAFKAMLEVHGEACLATYDKNSMTFSNAVAWRTVSCAYVVRIAIMNIRLRLAASAEGYVPIPVLAGWLRAPRSWWMRCIPEVPRRQWVLSFPFQLRCLLARSPEPMG